jgi:hypothetical protein
VRSPECRHKISDQADVCPSCGRRLTDRLDRLEAEVGRTRLEAELARIDLEWERERPKHVSRWVLGGKEVVPTKANAVVGATVIATIAIGLATAAIVADPEGGPVVGGIVIVVSLFVSFFTGIWVYSKAVDYQQAEAEYQRRRADVEAKCESTGENHSDESNLPSG